MSISIGRWGTSIKLRGFEMSLYLGDAYLKAPSVVEVAWNATGFYFETPSKRGKGETA